MDDSETLHRRARLRELVKVRFGGEQKSLLSHILSRTGKAANQGELSLLMKDHSGKSFGDKKARTLTEQIGLDRRWFEQQLGTGLEPHDKAPVTSPQAAPYPCAQEPITRYAESAAAAAAVEMAKQAQEVGLMWLTLPLEKKQEVRALIRSLAHSESDHADAEILSGPRRQSSKRIISDR